MDASYKLKAKTEDSIVQYFADVSVDSDDELAEMRKYIGISNVPKE